MKVVKQFAPTKKEFKPFDLILSVQTQEEAQALYAMFNCAPADKVLPMATSERIREAIGEEFHVSGRKSIIGNGVTYEEYYIP